MRKRKPKKRFLQPDPRFGDEMVTQFVNNMMWSGKKTTAFTIFYDAMDVVAEKGEGGDALAIWKKAIENITPQVQVRSRRVGGATFQIPTEVRPAQKLSIAMKWMILFARKRSGKGMATKLSAEILAAAKNEGQAVKRKEDTHRMAESNRAFAHFKV